MGRGDIRSLSRIPRVRRNPASSAEGAQLGAPGRADGSHSGGPEYRPSTPWRGHFGKDGACLPRLCLASGVWLCSLEGHLAAFPPRGALPCPADPSSASLRAGNLVICLPLVPREGMGCCRMLCSPTQPGLPPHPAGPASPQAVPHRPSWSLGSLSAPSCFHVGRRITGRDEQMMSSHGGPDSQLRGLQGGGWSQPITQVSGCWGHILVPSAPSLPASWSAGLLPSSNTD